MHNSKAPDDLMATQDASFDPDKTLCCKVENGHTLMHGTGGRGYGLGATCITSGCYQWKVRVHFHREQTNAKSFSDHRCHSICEYYVDFPKNPFESNIAFAFS